MTSDLRMTTQLGTPPVYVFGVESVDESEHKETAMPGKGERSSMDEIRLAFIQKLTNQIKWIAEHIEEVFSIDEKDMIGNVMPDLDKKHVSALGRKGVFTMRQLKKIALRDLRKFRGFGPMTVHAIIESLAKRGVTLREYYFDPIEEPESMGGAK